MYPNEPEGMARHLAYLAQHPEIAVGAHAVTVHPNDITLQGDEDDMVESARMLAPHITGRTETEQDGKNFLTLTARLDGVKIRHVSVHHHVFETDDDTRRCVGCGQLQGRAA